MGSDITLFNEMINRSWPATTGRRQAASFAIAGSFLYLFRHRAWVKALLFCRSFYEPALQEP